MDIISTDSQECKNNVINGVQVLNRIISLNHRPITILVPNDGIAVKEETVNTARQKIPRPANAFMLFANENRKKLAKLNPQESNKEISIRLGNQWKNLNTTLKDKYFSKAKEVDADHKRKYPDYVYNPKEARIRKAMRDRERSMGVSSVGNSQRTRRANWPRQSPHMPTPHNEHMMSTPSKDLRSVLRNELEHGFLANNSNYVYPAQQYLFSPQPDYAAYINSISSWNPTNTYNLQGNPSVQQHIWNQYQADRARASQSQGSAYLMSHPQSQPPDYHQQHVEHMSSGSMMQMGHVQKPSIHQNLENAASDVDRYLNMSTSMNIPRSSSTVPLEMTSSSRHLPPNNSQHTSVTNSRASDDNIRTMLDNTISSHVSNPETQTVRPISDIDTRTTPQESTCNTDANISNVTSMSEVDAAINLENTNDNAESGFSGMSVFEDEEIANVNAQEVRKNINSSQNKVFRLKPEVFETVPNSYYTIDKQIPPPFISPQTPCCIDFLNVDSNNNNSNIKKSDYPINFSTPKYYDTPACDNYELPIMAGDQFGGFICDEGYGLLNFQNQPDVQPTYTFAPNQIEMSQFLNDPCEILPIDLGSVKNEENCILDLSKMAEADEVIDVGVDNCSAEKLVEVSNKICEELAKII